MKPEERIALIEKLVNEIAQLTLDRPIVVKDGQPLVTDEDLDRYIRDQIRVKRSLALSLRGYPEPLR